jgi:asparagine synthase (glutamine-hydrolysing)
MCRIAGIVDPLNILNLQNDILKMTDAMHRGGPDDSGVYINGGLALGHRRLSLIDLSSDGHQPMMSTDERFVLIYNGEIYNFKELRCELINLGYRFKSTSDTEVILNGFIHWHQGIFERLNGMFAMAIYDNQEKCIILARDYAGIKPLYYYFEGPKLYFASEIRAFKALDKFEENTDWPIYFLAFGHLPEPITTLKNVKPLGKGTVLTYSIADQSIDIFSFNKFNFTNKITNRKESLTMVRKTLTDAVERHLISDAPIGLFLSGGIDSGLLTILAEPFLKENLQTLSIVFDENEFSEKTYQNIIIAQTKARHKSFTVTKQQFLEALPDMLEAMDQPSTDGINSYFICKYAKEAGLKAVLSGLGADELFGGYNSFAIMAKYELLRKCLPANAFKIFQFLNKDKYQKASFLAIPGLIGQYLFNRGLLCPKEIAHILHISESKIWKLLTDLNEQYESDFSTLDAFNKACSLESNLYMQNQLLKDSDYMSMWHGIEIRVPFLDKELIQLAYQINSGIKAFQGQKKYLLIHAIGDKLPREIWDRPKMGFTFPFQKWLEGNIEAELNSSKSYAQSKFEKGEFTWSRYLAIVMWNRDLKLNP